MSHILDKSFEAFIGDKIEDETEKRFLVAAHVQMRKVTEGLDQHIDKDFKERRIEFMRQLFKVFAELAVAYRVDFKQTKQYLENFLMLVGEFEKKFYSGESSETATSSIEKK